MIILSKGTIILRKIKKFNRNLIEISILIFYYIMVIFVTLNQ